MVRGSKMSVSKKNELNDSFIFLLIPAKWLSKGILKPSANGSGFYIAI
jgi:hypothetical protein